MIGAFQTDERRLDAPEHRHGRSAARPSARRSSGRSSCCRRRRSSGAILGGLLAWAVVRVSRTAAGCAACVIAACGVLAQFGGVMLAFAFLATFGFNGMATMFMRERRRRRSVGRDLAVRHDRARGRLHLLPDPVDGDRLPACARGAPQGVVGGVDQPGRLGLGTTGDMSAGRSSRQLPGRTAAAVRERLLRLRDGGGPGQPGQPDRHRCRSAARSTSEVVLGQANVGKALALGMIVVVTVVMVAYTLIQRRASRWVEVIAPAGPSRAPKARAGARTVRRWADPDPRHRLATCCCRCRDARFLDPRARRQTDARRVRRRSATTTTSSTPSSSRSRSRR